MCTTTCVASSLRGSNGAFPATADSEGEACVFPEVLAAAAARKRARSAGVGGGARLMTEVLAGGAAGGGTVTSVAALAGPPLVSSSSQSTHMLVVVPFLRMSGRPWQLWLGHASASIDHLHVGLLGHCKLKEETAVRDQSDKTRNRTKGERGKHINRLCYLFTHRVTVLAKWVYSPRKHEFSHFLGAFVQFQSARSLLSGRFRVRIVPPFGFKRIFCF